MNIGDRVKTNKGEYGTVVKQAFGMYDWFVDIEFRVGEKIETMRVPFMSEELTVIKDQR